MGRLLSYTEMKKYEISVPDGYELVEVKNGKYEVRKKEHELPKTWEEWSETHPIQFGEAYISDGEVKVISDETVGVGRHREFEADLLATKEQAESVLAFIKLLRLRDCYNKSEVGDRETSYIQYDKEEGEAYIWTVPEDTWNHVLTFNNEHLAEQFLANFGDLIEQAKNLI